MVRMFLIQAKMKFALIKYNISEGGQIMAFADLKKLRENMRDNEVAVFSTTYSYNNINCYIAFCLLTKGDKKKEKYQYALLRIRLIKQDNFDDYIDCPANSKGLSVKQGELRRFFNIEYCINGAGEWYGALIENIGNIIKPNIPNQTERLKSVSIDTVCRHENRVTNRTYRSHLLRHSVDANGKGKCRTEYNAQLASLKFPHLYEVYRTDRHVSFAFTDKPEEEVSEQEAYDRFIILENNRKR